jgi:hypothetical protein
MCSSGLMSGPGVSCAVGNGHCILYNTFSFFGFCMTLGLACKNASQCWGGFLDVELLRLIELLLATSRLGQKCASVSGGGDAPCAGWVRLDDGMPGWGLSEWRGWAAKYCTASSCSLAAAVGTL